MLIFVHFGEVPFNINMVRPERHYRHDPHRFPAGWYDMGDKHHPRLQLLERLPKWIKGGVIGGAGGAGIAGN